MSAKRWKASSPHGHLALDFMLPNPDELAIPSKCKPRFNNVNYLHVIGNNLALPECRQIISTEEPTWNNVTCDERKAYNQPRSIRSHTGRPASSRPYKSASHYCDERRVDDHYLSNRLQKNMWSNRGKSLWRNKSWSIVSFKYGKRYLTVI